MLPSQGLIEAPAFESYFNRAANGGLTCWYSGAENQTAHTAFAFAAGAVWAYPVVLDGGVIDTIAIECTTLGAGSAARCGIYKPTSELNLLPNELIVDSGELDTTSIGVKSTSGLSVAITPGLYWLSFISRATAPAVRALSMGSLPHISGIAAAMGANLNGGWSANGAYGALPNPFRAGIVTTPGSIVPLVAIHYAS